MKFIFIDTKEVPDIHEIRE